MTEPLRLNTLAVGEQMTVCAVEGEPYMKKRLEDLGFCADTQVTCLYKAPLGDPTAYLMRGTVIALRSRDAAGVIGTEVGHGCE
ncbi:MAG: ferrous iron transport protein A [Clostridia bacterium]|nr:ferrous iron transport protein A [Clostridia bacterium]